MIVTGHCNDIDRVLNDIDRDYGNENDIDCDDFDNLQ